MDFEKSFSKTENSLNKVFLDSEGNQRFVGLRENLAQINFGLFQELEAQKRLEKRVWISSS